MRSRNRVGGDVYCGPDFPSLPGFLSRWVVLAIALITGITGWSHHTTHLRRNVQIFHFYTNPQCSLVIFCLSIGFIWSPSCFSQKLFFSLSGSLFSPGPNSSFIKWVTGWACVLSSCPNTGLDTLPVLLLGQISSLSATFFFPSKLSKQLKIKATGPR